MEKLKILYIIYFDIKENGGTASRVRPKKILEAFEREGVDVRLLSGDHRKYRERHKSVQEIIHYIENNKIDFCYIELRSGPLFHKSDRSLIRLLHRKGIRTGAFYRDLYWMFPKMFIDGSGVMNKIKGKIIHAMQKRDLKLLKNSTDIIYIPSETIGNHLNIHRYEVLPPGCDLAPDVDKPVGEKLTALYVGGASERYGTHLLLDSFNRASKEGDIHLILVCPEKQWRNLPAEYQAYEKENWLTLRHLCSDELPEVYRESDIGIVPLLKNTYNDFAVPVKLYEYVSYKKPVLTTNCTESAAFVERNKIGFVVDDNVESMSQGILRFYHSKQKMEDFRGSLEKTFLENRWDARAKKIIEDLTGAGL